MTDAMTIENLPDPEEQRLAALLRAADRDAAPVDAALLSAFETMSTEAFVAASEASSVIEPTIPGNSSAATVVEPASQKTNSPARRSKMVTLLYRGAMAVAASVVALVLWLNPYASSVSGAVPFAQVMENLRSAHTLQFRLIQSAAGRPTEAEIWFRAPGLVRREESPQRYQIAAGSRWWQIDEAENSVAIGDSPWFRSPQTPVDLLALLDVGVSDSAALLSAQPVGRESHAGRDCHVYRVDVPTESDHVEIEALADARTHQLVLLRAMPPAKRQAVAVAPLAQLELVAINANVADEKFVVSKTLSEDGRIGKVSAAQGVVVLRPMLAKRWTPVCRETVLKPGDWLRTEHRGPNAIKATFTSNVELTLGPGSLLECLSPTQARLHSGQVQVSFPPQETDKTPTFMLLAPRRGDRQFHPGEKQLLRTDRDDKLVNVPAAPVWLTGFEGTSSNESLGSLIVNLPDGRNEPLTVGYHKVTVEIRDQIARTTIEESFVNHTLSRLEGVFHFPLPQDASISGFGMWIGNDLIEADVVEKQRAREIYETILREKRDPGLLEWTSGNLFKARVFPIEPRSEKRVKIVYTQVLPLRAQRYRYTYGLRSDLLQTKPLRELSLSVTVNSALPLKSISCPSHAVRTQQTGHSAQVEFTAQEYTPTRDFEVVCELDRTQADVVAIPHRRGDDGYLLVQLTPPGGQGNWQREVLPDGQPLHLVLLCDTSASMDSENRKHQAEFVTTVLSSLGADDRFQLAACDVGTVWAFGEPVAADAEHISLARTFLDERLSLGWTNLDRAFTDVIQKAPADAHVIYIGDGIVSAGDTDASNFVKRVNLLFGTSTEANKDQRRTFHAIGVGNTTELVALRGIALSGGGSVRMIAGEQSSSVVALELLNEIAQPGLRDLKVEFKGVKVAAVYPDRLPNLPAGMQQILVARYLPQGADQQGEIIVTGRRGSETVRFAAKVEFKDAEDGNSFIPRLWARSHLDQLLGQGNSPAIQDEIIRLSEEFHIITPYTSLLVLETDADRERFGVKRRYEMRDGERFFAEGRDAAQFDLLQAQMKRAGDWRQGLRRQALRSLASWGRDAQAFREGIDLLNRRERHRYAMPMRSSGRVNLNRLSDREELWAGLSGAFGRGGDRVYRDYNGPMGGGFGGGGYANGLGLEDEFSEFDHPDSDGGRRGDLQKSLSNSEFSGFDVAPAFDEDDKKQDAAKDSVWDISDKLERAGGARGPMPSGKPMDARLLGALSAAPFDGFKRKAFIAYEPQSRGTAGRLYAGQKAAYGESYPEFELSWLNTIFPTIPSAPVKATTPPTERWSAEAVALSESLLRMTALQQRQGGIELRRVTESHDPRWQRSTGTSRDLVLVSPRDWLARPLNPGADIVVNYCRDAERGVFSSMLQLGSRRPAVDADRTSPPLSLHDFSDTPLHQTYQHYSARIEPAGENRAWLILQYPNTPTAEHCLIDTARHVLLRREQRNGDKRIFTITFDDFVEIDRRWWARKVVMTDEKDRRVSETAFTIEPLSPEQFQQRMTAELAGLPKVQLLSQPLLPLKKARQDVADGRAGFDALMRMALHFASLQQWDDLGKQIAAIEALSADKPGVRWLRILMNASIRRNEEARQALLAEAKQLVAQPQPFDLPLATFVLNQTYPISAWPEFYQLVELIGPVYDRQPAELDARSTWLDFQLRSFDALQRKTEALELAQKRSASQPWQLHWQTDYASRLMAAGQPEAAYAWLQQELDRRVERPLYEEETLRTALAEQYRTQARWTDLLQFTSAWIARDPESQAYYTPYAIHLSALVYAGQLDAAYALADQWLKDAQREGPMPAPVRARLDAALNFAAGNAYQLSFYRMPVRWYGPLADTARYFFNHRDELDIVQRATSHHQFGETDVADELRGEWFRKLQSGAATLSPAKVQHLVGWTLSGRMQVTEPIAGRTQLLAQEVPDALWTDIVAVLLPRWQATEKPDERHALSEALRSIYTTRFRTTLLLPFLRNRLATADQDHRQAYRSTLFEELLATAWTAEIETESFSLLHDMTDATDPYDRLETHLPLLYRWVDAMVANRQAAALKTLQDAGGQQELTRKELAVKKAEIRTAALRGLVTKLAELIPQEAEPLAAWVRMERFWLLGQLNEGYAETEAECWAILGEVPPKPLAINEDDDEPRLATDEDQREALRLAFTELLQSRALSTVTFLATRRSATPDSIERLLKYIDAGLAHGGDVAAAWKQEKMRLLIALDRPDDLDRLLREWAKDDGSTAPWRIMLAHLAAERGQVAEAITLFEAAEKDKLLSFADYRLLADWYLVMNRRADADRAKLEAMLQTPEHILNNAVNQTRYRWTRRDGALPSELDEQTLLTYRALFRKSATPESYIDILHDQYTACRDFRLLQMLPEAMLGRTPQQVYAFIQAVRSQLLYEVRNEATADEILAGIAKLRTAERTPTDLRALDLLEATVERQSAEVLNQPGPHVTACLAAMKRAFDREWQPGEPVAMANFLYQWGGLPKPELVEEQLRELRALQKQTGDDPRAHLLITNDLANLLGWSYSKKDEALREMEAEVRSYAKHHDGIWPHQDSAVLGSFISLYEGATQHAAGEKVLLQFRAKPEHEEQVEWIDQRLITLYNHALEHQGAVSLGSGEQLFANIVKRVLKEIEDSSNENTRFDRVSRIMTTFDIAHRRMIKGAHEALRSFAFETIPVVLQNQQTTYRNTAQVPLATVITALGPVDGLLYAIERVEQYPARLEIQWDNAWNAFGYELARQREAASGSGMDIAALETRLLKIAVDRLQRDLRGNEGNSQYLYYRHYGHFWAAKAPEFARAAEAVLAERPNSGRRTILVANYLRNGLDLEARAIEVLHIAHRKGVLDEAGQTQLVNWLEAANRFAEMIPILEPLVTTRPDNINYRVQLMVAYQRTMRSQQMHELRQQTDEYFHAGGRWTEGNISALAYGCFRSNQFDQTVKYYDEAIAVHQRTYDGSPMNDGTLSSYYGTLASAHSALGHTREAVDAATASIVCWSPRHEQRANQLNTLNAVIRQAKDLDAYVAHLNAEAAKTGQDSPVVRKAIGSAYQSRSEHAKAVIQFQLALELQPFDKEVHQALIACYDALQQPDNVAKQLLKLIDFDRHDLTLFKQLADRYQKNEAEAERAATSIIEAAPNEAENQAALAELRQTQDRWDEAIPHWQRVSELRKLEPMGLLKLAAAQIHQKQWPAAKETVTRLQKGEWPSRFNNVQNETRQLQEQLPK